MEIRKKYNPLTGTYEYYNIITHEWVMLSGNSASEMSGTGVFDTLASIASKVATKATSDTAKKVAEAALESTSKRAGDEAVKYAFEKVRKQKTRPGIPIDIAKELKETNDPKENSPHVYRGGKLKKYNYSNV